MNSAVSVNKVSSIEPFSFQSFGVNVRIESNRKDIIDEAKTVVRKSLLNWIRPSKNLEIDQLFRLIFDRNGTYLMIQNGEEIASGDSRKNFFKLHGKYKMKKRLQEKKEPCKPG